MKARKDLEYFEACQHIDLEASPSTFYTALLPCRHISLSCCHKHFLTASQYQTVALEVAWSLGRPPAQRPSVIIFLQMSPQACTCALTAGVENFKTAFPTLEVGLSSIAVGSFSVLTDFVGEFTTLAAGGSSSHLQEGWLLAVDCRAKSSIAGLGIAAVRHGSTGVCSRQIRASSRPWAMV